MGEPHCLLLPPLSLSLAYLFLWFLGDDWPSLGEVVDAGVLHQGCKDIAETQQEEDVQSCGVGDFGDPHPASQAYGTRGQEGRDTC